MLYQYHTGGVHGALNDCDDDGVFDVYEDDDGDDDDDDDKDDGDVFDDKVCQERLESGCTGYNLPKYDDDNDKDDDHCDDYDNDDLFMMMMIVMLA